MRMEIRKQKKEQKEKRMQKYRELLNKKMKKGDQKDE